MACGWTVSYAGCPGDQEFLDSLDPEVKANAEEMATDLLDQWTGGLFGACPETIRPCRGFATDPHRALGEFWEGATRVTSPWMPVLVEGRWYNIACGTCGSRCACEGGTEVLSLPWPVEAVTMVQIDGAVLPPDAYRVDAHRLLVRTDGGSWPVTQDMSANPGEPNTFVIEYLHGAPVPIGGQIAAGVLAMELAKAMCNDGTCQLPQRVQTVTRQGVTVAMLDGFEDLEDGRVGIWLVDSWVSSVTQPIRRATVHSVDIPRGRGGVRSRA